MSQEELLQKEILDTLKDLDERMRAVENKLSLLHGAWAAVATLAASAVAVFPWLRDHLFR